MDGKADRTMRWRAHDRFGARITTSSETLLPTNVMPLVIFQPSTGSLAEQTGPRAELARSAMRYAEAVAVLTTAPDADEVETRLLAATGTTGRRVLPRRP